MKQPIQTQILAVFCCFAVMCFGFAGAAAAVPMDPNGIQSPGWEAIFNGCDLTGWKGLMFSPYDNPIQRALLSEDQRRLEQEKADADMRKHWAVKEGVLCFDGKGRSIATVQQYRNFELFADWLIEPNGDSGIYLRGTPQVQIWDPQQWKIGSGGLYNNQIHPSEPLVIADNPAGQWNRFFIRMIQDRVTVFLNNRLVADNVVLENYWDPNRPVFEKEQIELQCHGTPVQFRRLYIRPLSPDDPWITLFNGVDFTGWVGDTDNYVVENGVLICGGGGKNLFTQQQYSDFHLKFEFLLTPGSNNGIAIRAPLTGNAAYEGMELQVLDNPSPQYADLKPYQYHGSIYGVVPAKRDFLKPVGSWNRQEVIAQGNRIQVILNGEPIVDADIADKISQGTLDGNPHPGLARKAGHIGFLGHGSEVRFRNITLKELSRRTETTKGKQL
ncbi:MAG: DUF1080 domain-containing protein [Planctomycetales bacterium]|nr:DUF1080 domain-containing protein [Planctomycetales bacterium]